MTISYPIIGTLNEESWALIPSEPAIFHDMMNEYGVKDVRVQDLVTFDFDVVKDEKMHGLIFISKYDDETAVQLNLKEPDPDADSIIFTSQVVTNVCGTLALLAILFNAEISHKGPIIDNFLQFTDGFTPVNRGMCIGNSVEMRRIHDAFGKGSLEVDKAYLKFAANDNSSTNDTTMEVETEPVYHYTSFIYKNGFVWEIDGLKPRPIKIGASDPNNWVDVVEPILRKRVQVLAEKYGDEYFNLLGILDDHFPTYTKRNQILDTNLKKFDKVISSKAKSRSRTIRGHKNDFYKNTEEDAPDFELLKHIWDELDKGNTESILNDVETVRTIYNSLNDKVQTYESNKEVFEKDAKRQKFDYFPFINTLISIAHKKGLVEDPAEQKKREAALKRKKRKGPTKSKASESNDTAAKKRKSISTDDNETVDKPVRKRKR